MLAQAWPVPTPARRQHSYQPLDWGGEGRAVGLGEEGVHKEAVVASSLLPTLIG